MSFFADLARAVSHQRKAMILAAAMMVASFWIAVPMGHWRAGLAGAIGVGLGAINHALTEFSLLQALDDSELPTRKQYGASSLYRLVFVSVIGIGAAALLWPDGIAVLFGLALFHAIALIFTGLPLLREMRKV